MLSVQEVTFYNDLVEKNIAGKINCPFDTSDVVVTKVNDKNEERYFTLECLDEYHRTAQKRFLEFSVLVMKYYRQKRLSTFEMSYFMVVLGAIREFEQTTRGAMQVEHAFDPHCPAEL